MKFLKLSIIISFTISEENKNEACSDLILLPVIFNVARKDSFELLFDTKHGKERAIIVFVPVGKVIEDDEVVISNSEDEK